MKYIQKLFMCILLSTASIAPALATCPSMQAPCTCPYTASHDPETAYKSSQVTLTFTVENEGVSKEVWKERLYQIHTQALTILQQLTNRSAPVGAEVKMAVAFDDQESEEIGSFHI